MPMRKGSEPPNVQQQSAQRCHVVQHIFTAAGRFSSNICFIPDAGAEHNCPSTVSAATLPSPPRCTGPCAAYCSCAVRNLNLAPHLGVPAEVGQSKCCTAANAEDQLPCMRSCHDKQNVPRSCSPMQLERACPVNLTRRPSSAAKVFSSAAVAVSPAAGSGIRAVLSDPTRLRQLQAKPHQHHAEISSHGRLDWSVRSATDMCEYATVCRSPRSWHICVRARASDGSSKSALRSATA